MKMYNICTNLIRVIKNLYDKATSAILFNSSIALRLVLNNSWSPTGCLLSPTLLNIFLERIMTDALEDHKGTVNSGGRRSTNLHFADDIDGLAGGEGRTGKIS